MNVWKVAASAAAGALALCWAGAVAAQEGETVTWGAIAVDKRHAAYAEVHDYPSRAAAEAAAIERAEGMGSGYQAKLITSWSGKGCGSYVAEIIPQAVGTNNFGADGWGVGPNLFSAQAAADKDLTAPRSARSRTRVEGCNAKTEAPIKVAYSAPKASPDDCLVQFELQLDDLNDNWKSRIYSPVYRLAKADCPVAGDSEYSGYTSRDDNGAADNVSSNLPTKNEAELAKGYAMTEKFLVWTRTRRPPVSGIKYRLAASSSVTIPDEKILAEMVENTGGRDSGDSAGIGDGLCIAYAPEGIAPVEVLGAENCRRWAN